jgi:transcriptional regulator with XRE-family HTH domain
MNLAYIELFETKMHPDATTVMDVDPSSCTFFSFRVRRNLTLREISELTGLSIATLNRLDRGTYQPTRRTCNRLQKGLGISEEELEKMLGNTFSGKGPLARNARKRRSKPRPAPDSQPASE